MRTGCRPRHLVASRAVTISRIHSKEAKCAEQSWERWYAAIRNELLDQQKPEGYWTDQVCDEYGTAMALLVLQMPNNYVPIFQR